MITIVTGIKNSGKSSYLYDWFFREPIGCGILSMKRYSGNKHEGYDLLFLPSGERINLCSMLPDRYIAQKDDLIQGNYIFDSRAFDTAYRFIIENMPKNNEPIWLDEIGQMEIEGKGFLPIIKLANSLDKEMRIGVRLSCVYEFSRMLHNNEFHIIYATSG